MDKLRFGKDSPKMKLSHTTSNDAPEDSEEGECSMTSGSESLGDGNSQYSTKANQGNSRLYSTQPIETMAFDKTTDMLRTSRRKGHPMRNVIVTPIKSYQCEVCGKSFHQHKRYVHHIESHNEVLVKSEQCDIRFPSPNPNAGVSDECSLECDLCGQVCRNKAAFLRHRKSHTNDYECEYCGRDLPSVAMLKAHMKFCKKAKQCIKDVTDVVLRKNLNNSMILRSSRNKQQESGEPPSVKGQPSNKLGLKGKNFKANTLKGNRGRPRKLSEDSRSEKNNKLVSKVGSSGCSSINMTQNSFKHPALKKAVAHKKVPTTFKTKQNITTEGQNSLTSDDPLKLSAIKFANMSMKLNKIKTDNVLALKTPVTKSKLQVFKCSTNNRQISGSSSKPAEVSAENFKTVHDVDGVSVQSVVLERQGPHKLFLTLSSLLGNMNKITSPAKGATDKLQGSKCTMVDPCPKELQDDGINSPEETNPCRSSDNDDSNDDIDDDGDEDGDDNDHGRDDDVKERSSENNKDGQKKEGVKIGNAPSTSRLLIHALRRKKTSFPKGRQQCPICRREFLNLRAHQKTHTMARPHRCKKCGMSFFHVRYLQRHMTTHMNKYKCGVCSQEFTQKRLAQRHAKIHMADKPFCCEVCNRGFRCRKDLRKHVEIHTGVKKYMCDICGKRCRLRSTFLTHQRVHTGEKPYVCEICGKSFAYSSGLRVHKFSHTSGKPYRCLICGESFPHNYLLKRHRAMHGDSDESNVTQHSASNETESPLVRHVPSNPEVLKGGQTNVYPVNQDTGAKEEMTFSDGLSVTKDETRNASLFQHPMQYPPPFAPSYMPPPPPVHIHHHTGAPSITGTVPPRQMLPNVPLMSQPPQNNAPPPIHVPGAPHVMLHQHTIQSVHQTPPPQTEQVSHTVPSQQSPQVPSIHHQSRMTSHVPGVPDMAVGHDDQFSLIRSIFGPDMLMQNLHHGSKRHKPVDPIVVAIPVSVYNPQENNSDQANG